MKKRIAFVWDFFLEPLEIYGWADGLHMALKILAAKHDVEVFPIPTGDTTEIYDRLRMIDPQFILAWGDLARPSFGGIKQFGVPTGLCFAGGTTEHGNRDNFDVIFVENDEYVKRFAKDGYKVKRAFGVNDALFAPTIHLKPQFSAIYPAAFMPWKRHDLFAKAAGDRGLAVGAMFAHEKDCFNVCFENGVAVMPKVPYEVLPWLISQSLAVVVTAAKDGGSQRTVLEAMSMNKPVIVTSDNVQCVEYVKEADCGIIVEPEVVKIREALKRLDDAKADKGRMFVEMNYSAEIYAQQLWEGIKKYL